MRTPDVGYGKRHHHPVRMVRGLLIHRIDEIESVLGEVALIGLGIDPDREEFRSEIPTLGLVEADVPNIVRIGGPDVEAFIQKTLRSVGMSVNHNGRFLNRARFRADGNVRTRLTRRLDSGKATKRGTAEEEAILHSHHLYLGKFSIV